MYVKLFRSMYEGTLASRGPWEALQTFIHLLILADKEGFVDITHESIARITTLPLEIVRKGIEELEKPDPYSRREENEGRRIVRIDERRPWGWKITNYEHYRQIRSAEERREYMRQLMAHKRAEQKEKPEVKDDSPIVHTLPLIQGEFDVHQSFIDELIPIYPRVDIHGTLTEMKGWLIGNPARKKTRRGIKSFITRWLAKEQEKYESQA